MRERRYSAAGLTVMSWDEAVRKRPGIYFGGFGRSWLVCGLWLLRERWPRVWSVVR